MMTIRSARAKTSDARRHVAPTRREPTPLVDALIADAVPDESEGVWPSWVGIHDCEPSTDRLRETRRLVRVAQLRTRRPEEMLANIDRQFERLRDVIAMGLMSPSFQWASQRNHVARRARKPVFVAKPDQAREQIRTLEVALMAAVDELEARRRRNGAT